VIAAASLLITISRNGVVVQTIRKSES